jgi:hypothetical protein
MSRPFGDRVGGVFASAEPAVERPSADADDGAGGGGVVAVLDKFEQACSTLGAQSGWASGGAAAFGAAGHRVSVVLAGVYLLSMRRETGLCPRGLRQRESASKPPTFNMARRGSAQGKIPRNLRAAPAGRR